MVGAAGPDRRGVDQDADGDQREVRPAVVQRGSRAELSRSSASPTSRPTTCCSGSGSRLQRLDMSRYGALVLRGRLGHRGVQEGQHDVADQVGAGQPEEVGGAREHGQLRGGHADEVAVDVAAAQLQEPDGVLQLDGVAVADGDQGRCGDAADVVVGPAGEAPVVAAELVEQVLQPVRVRRLGQVLLPPSGVPAIMSTVISPTASAVLRRGLRRGGTTPRRRSACGPARGAGWPGAGRPRRRR